jgi:hypothetical protein
MSEIFLILRIDQITNVYGFVCKIFIINVRFQWNLKYLADCEKNINIKSNESPTSGALIFHAFRRAGRRLGGRASLYVAVFSRCGGVGGKYEEANTFRSLAKLRKNKRQKKKSGKGMLSNVRSVSCYGHHHTYRLTILEQNTLLRQKPTHVSWNDHCLLIFSRQRTCGFAYIFPSL